MKMLAKIGMVVMVLGLLMLILAGCHPVPAGASGGENTSSEVEMYGPFEIIERGSGQLYYDDYWFILADPETAVLYYCDRPHITTIGLAVSITPLYNADGTLKTRSK